VIREERERLTAELRAFDVVERIWPSAANFFLIRVADTEAVLRHCRDEHVLLRDFDGSLAGCIRISVGTRSENDRLLHCFRRINGDPA